MNYSQIQDLVLSYKKLDNSQRTLRNSLFNQIFKCYEPIINLNLTGMHLSQHEEFRQMAATDLAISLYEYDKKKSSFNTFFYYKLINIRKRFFRLNNTYFTEKENKVTNWHRDDETSDNDYLLMDLKLDLSKVLTPEEILILKQSYKKNIRNVDGVIDQIINKILCYT